MFPLDVNVSFITKEAIEKLGLETASCSFMNIDLLPGSELQAPGGRLHAHQSLPTLWLKGLRGPFLYCVNSQDSEENLIQFHSILTSFHGDAWTVVIPPCYQYLCIVQKPMGNRWSFMTRSRSLSDISLPTHAVEINACNRCCDNRYNHTIQQWRKKTITVYFWAVAVTHPYSGTSFSSITIWLLNTYSYVCIFIPEIICF